MCWNCLGEAIPQKASTDKKVYKIVLRRNLKEFTSYFRYYPYQLDIKCPLRKLEVEYNWDFLGKKYCSIVTGYHSYNINLFFVKDLSMNSLKVLGPSTVLEYYILTEKLCGLECIIPKGALFYENENGEIVSETIIPIKAFELCVGRMTL